jgi:hypothetical protein
MAKKKRRMPNHIVLPNGMWRFIKGKAKTIKRKAKRIRVKTKRRAVRMARRRKSKSFGGGGSKLSRGLFPVHGIVASALIGAGAATLQEKFLPQMIPYQGEAIGFAVGGVGGAAGAFARSMLKGGSTGGSLGNY